MTYTQEEKRSRIRGIVGAASGNLVEWFDFYIYAVFAAYFTQALTAPDMDSTTKSIYVWGGVCRKLLYASDWKLAIWSYCRSTWPKEVDDHINLSDGFKLLFVCSFAYL